MENQEKRLLADPTNKWNRVFEKAAQDEVGP
jgi:hypothetical protein